MAKTLGFLLPLVFLAVYSTVVFGSDYPKGNSFTGPTTVISNGKGAHWNCNIVCGEDLDDPNDLGYCSLNSEMRCICACYFRGFDWFHFREFSADIADATDDLGCGLGLS